MHVCSWDYNSLCLILIVLERVNYDYVQQAIVLDALSRRNDVYHTAIQTTVREVLKFQSLLIRNLFFLRFL